MRVFHTTQGDVPVWGDLDRFQEGRPFLFVVRGAFPDIDTLSLLPARLPHADVALVHLPGMHTPFFAEPSIEGFAQAFDEVVAALGRKPALVAGISTGALVALAMRSADALFLVEPPLSPAEAWPLVPQFREWARDDADVARWVEALFGYAPDQIHPRDYTHLLAGSAPGVVLLGGVPLEPPRNFDRIPSLVSQADRTRITAAGRLKAIVFPGVGHNVPYLVPNAFLDLLSKALDELFGRRGR